MIRSRILGAAAALAIAGASAVALAPSAGAATNLVTCSGLNSIASLNPTIGSNDARYIKVATKDSDGTKLAFLTLAPIPADSLTCLVDSGIRTPNNVIDNGTGKYTLDDQTGGNAVLSTSGALAKTSASIFGASTCNSTDTANVQSDYPNGYPLQGKTTWKFDQLDAASKQIQVQQYIRTGRDDADPDATHISIKGIVIKGPGLGGDVRATLRLFPTSSTKNLNVLECTDTNVANDSTEASIAELSITQADGSDGDTAVDPWTVSIP